MTYAEVDAAAQRLPPIAHATAPLVSVLMSAHDVADYIEAAVTSVLRQTWPRLELVVVDDASTDNTWVVLQRLSKTDGRLRIARLNTNLGTYFAKNFGLTMAQGEYVFFQDGDDISHPERIRLGMHVLTQPGVVAVNGTYSRVRFPSGQVLPINGDVKKLGLITLGVRRQVFDELGFFNCTMKASDDEFFKRVAIWANKTGAKICPLSEPTYYNTLREGSLFADMIANDPDADGRIEQRLSPSRASYVEAFTTLHRELGAREAPITAFRDFFRFPVLRDLMPLAPDMRSLPNPALPVVASLCSIPERATLLQRTLATLAPQVDELHIYLDRYEAVPDFVSHAHPRLRVVLSREVPGLRDSGKFLPLASLARECFYFTADDDLLYPPDYVATLVRRIEHYGRQAVVGVHGVLLPEQPVGYFSGYRKVFMFNQALERDALVNNLGTGTLAFHSGLLKGLTLQDFPTPGMADLHLSVFCKRNAVPMVAVARHDAWLNEQDSPNTSLFHEFKDNDAPQRALVLNNRPWGFTPVVEAVTAGANRTPDESVAERLRRLVPLLHAYLK